jgi:two-component system sensor histidine kinase KdpD
MDSVSTAAMAAGRGIRGSRLSRVQATTGPSRALPRLTRGALTRRRVVAGFVLTFAVGPLLTWLLYAFRTPESITSDVLSFQLFVVIVALVGGIWPAVTAAVLSGLTLDYLFVAPQFQVAVADPLHLWALCLYVLTALLVSYVVDQAARRERAATRAAAEAALLTAVAGSVLRGESAAPTLVSKAREAFRMTGVRLVGADGAVLATDGEPVPDGRVTSLPVGHGTGATLELHGGTVDAADRRLLDVVVAQLGAALERAELAETARAAEVLAEADRVRTALLSAVSHDVRRPLAAAIAAVGGLRAAGDELSAGDRAELVATAEESLSALTKLVTDLLDVSRVQAGVLAVSLRTVDLADVVAAALDELGAGPQTVDLDLDAGPTTVTADPVLLLRVVVNVLDNALGHSPDGAHVAVTTASGPDGTVELRIVDRGEGIAPERRDDMFAPFQRFGDTDNGTGLGLGLALSKGFTEGMGGRLTPADTPGGGLTMVLSLPEADTEVLS